MGLVGDFPAARVADAADSVPVYDGRRVIGHLGPDDSFHSAATNVTCRITRRNGSWYKIWNAAGWDPTAATAYVSAARTVLINTDAPNPMHDCVNNTDNPGPPWWRDVLVTTTVLGIGAAAALAARRFVRRERRPGPQPPPVVPPEIDVEGRAPVG